jgi:hypothetical protein
MGIGAAALAVSLGACATSQARQMDQMLAASGFQVRPAFDAERQQQLATMKPLTLTRIVQDGQNFWVVADPKVCQCLYVGNEAAYQRYSQLALQKQLQDEALMTAEMNEDASMNWGMWGPWGPWGY